MANTPLTQLSDAMMNGINAAALRAAFDQFYAEFHSLLDLRDREIRRLRNDLTALEGAVESLRDLQKPAAAVAADSPPVEVETGPAGPASSSPDGD